MHSAYNYSGFIDLVAKPETFTPKTDTERDVAAEAAPEELLAPPLAKAAPEEGET